MARKVDLRLLWDTAKHGVVAESDVVACEAMLERSEEADLHLAILVVGLARKPTQRLIRVMEAYLREGSLEAERYAAMRVLCRYWGLWPDYLSHLFVKVQTPSWEMEYAVAEEATRLLGDFLQVNPAHKGAWLALLGVYHDAVLNGDLEKEGVAYWSIFKALRGASETLKSQLAGRRDRDEQLLRQARRQAEGVS